MYCLHNMCRTNSTLLISVWVLLPLVTNTAVATIKTTVSNDNTEKTNYHQNKDYKDAAAAAALPLAEMPPAATVKDYSQQLPQNYPLASAVNAVLGRHDGTSGGSANVPAEPSYQNYFETSDVDRGKIGSTTVIRRDQKAHWSIPAVNGRQMANGGAEQGTMTVTGFVPTTLTAAGQHYVTGMNTAIDVLQGGNNYAEAGGVDASNREGAARVNNGDSYAYLPPERYEINEDNYERTVTNSGREAFSESDANIKMSTADVYELHKYHMNEYAKEMQRVIAENAADSSEGSYDEATTDADSSNQGGGSYFENRLSGLQNYFMPTYQIEQFSNYHNQAEHAPSIAEGQQEAEQQQKSNREKVHEQPQIRPLALFDGGGGAGGDDSNAILQQFNNGENIENYANDREKLRYYVKQPPQQQEQLQRERQHQQQQQVREQQQHQQQQQLQLSHQLREFPQLMQFSVQNLNMQQHPQHRLAPANLQATNQRPNDKTILSARLRQQHQLQHQNRDAVSSLQVIGNVARRRLQPTKLNFNIDSDNQSSSKSGSSFSDSNEKSSISDNFADSTNSPSQYHYAYTQAYAHTQPSSSQLGDDSVNEVDDKHNNIDETGSSSSNNDDAATTTTTTNSSHDQHKYFVTTTHNQEHKEIVPWQQHSSTVVPQYTLPPITSTIRHTAASSAALAGIPLSRHVEVTKHIPVITDYQRIHVPYNQSVPIQIPQTIVTAIPRPYAIHVPVTKTIAIPKVQDVRIPVERVKTYPVERPVPFVVERRVPYMVEKQVAKPIYYPYPVQVPIVKTIVHKVFRRPHNFLTYQPHSISYPFSLGQYHLQHQHTSPQHSLNKLHYTRTRHFG